MCETYISQSIFNKHNIFHGTAGKWIRKNNQYIMIAVNVKILENLMSRNYSTSELNDAHKMLNQYGNDIWNGSKKY